MLSVLAINARRLAFFRMMPPNRFLWQAAYKRPLKNERHCGQQYQMVKDLRTNVEKGNAQGVLDGDLDDFIEASLAARVGNQR